MKLQEVGRYRVEPFALERILELELVTKVNEHTKFHAKGVLKEGKKDKLIKEDWDDRPVRLTEDGAVLFWGLVQDITVTCENSIYYLEVEAVSMTIKLDLKKRKRSFQEKGRSYNSIASELAGEAGGIVKYLASEKKIESLLLQYRETDWEFLKRLASHCGSVLVPDSRAPIPSFTFGTPIGKSYRKETGSIKDYSVRKNASSKRKLTLLDLILMETETEEYTIKTAHVAAEIGDRVKISGDMMHVREVHAKLNGSVFIYTITATSISGISAGKTPHPYASGLTLSGKVLKAVNDTVYVHLSIDKVQSIAKAYPFPYATGFSNEQHTGWYVMPEEGDTVQVIFPTEDEGDAYAVQSVRRKDTDKMDDPRVKYLRTADGKEIKLDQKEILITANDGVTLIRINEDSGVDVFTDKEVQVISKGNITVESEDNISMTSKNDFSIHAGKNLVITAEDSIDMTCDENNLTMTPGGGTSMSAGRPIRVTGEDKIDITSDGRMTVKSKDNMRLAASKNLSAFSDKKLSLSASSALEEFCSGSSVKLDGNISMKAALIKEN